MKSNTAVDMEARRSDHKAKKYWVYKYKLNNSNYISSFELLQTLVHYSWHTQIVYSIFTWSTFKQDPVFILLRAKTAGDAFKVKS